MNPQEIDCDQVKIENLLVFNYQSGRGYAKDFQIAPKFYVGEDQRNENSKKKIL